MDKLIDKISSYNLFNYFLPGVLFSVITANTTHFIFLTDNPIMDLLIVYFIGLVISRVGSLIIEPILKKVSFLKFGSYEDYISASQKNPKIDILSESNNMYRTFSAMLILVILLKVADYSFLKFSALKPWGFYLLIVFLLILFLYAYKKQTDYIGKRIKSKK